MHNLIRLSRKKRSFINIAKKVAERSEFYPYRHGAILAKGSSILSTSENKNKYNSFADRFCQHNGIATIHAELGCILGVNNSITRNGSIYVVRIGKKGQLKNSKPCCMCMSCMSFVGIKKVYYSIDEESLGVVSIR